MNFLDSPDDDHDEGTGMFAGFCKGEHDDDLKGQNESRAIKTRNRQLFRSLASERQLEGILDWEFEPGAAYHVLSAGDIDGFSFIKFALRQQPLQYALLSTWCMAAADIEELGRLLALGRIGRLDSYVGEIFQGTYGAEWGALCEMHKKYGGRAAIFRNHTKIFVGFGPRFDFVIESSANINTNPRAENTVITLDRGLASFYKEYFDGIKSFDRQFDAWEPYEC